MHLASPDGVPVHDVLLLHPRNRSATHLGQGGGLDIVLGGITHHRSLGGVGRGAREDRHEACSTLKTHICTAAERRECPTPTRIMIQEVPQAVGAQKAPPDRLFRVPTRPSARGHQHADLHGPIRPHILTPLQPPP